MAADILPEHVRIARAALVRHGAFEDLDDLVQDVLVMLLRMEPGDTFAGLLHVIARGVALHRWRSRRREGRAVELYARDRDAADDHPTPEEERIAADREALLRAAIDDVPPPWREALVAVEIEGATIEEYASSAGLKYNTAKDRVRVGRERLAEAVRRHMARRRLRPGDV